VSHANRVKYLIFHKDCWLKKSYKNLRILKLYKVTTCSSYYINHLTVRIRESRINYNFQLDFRQGRRKIFSYFLICSRCRTHIIFTDNTTINNWNFQNLYMIWKEFVGIKLLICVHKWSRFSAIIDSWHCNDSFRYINIL